MKATKKGKKKTGRKTLYRPDFPSRVDAYIESLQDEKDKLPTLEDLCLRHLKVHSDTAQLYEKRYPAFKRAMKRLRMFQKQKLIERATGRYNPAMPIFLLKVLHGMKEPETNKNKELLIKIKADYLPNKKRKSLPEVEVEEGETIDD